MVPGNNSSSVFGFVLHQIYYSSNKINQNNAQVWMRGTAQTRELQKTIPTFNVGVHKWKKKDAKNSLLRGFIIYGQNYF